MDIKLLGKISLVIFVIAVILLLLYYYSTPNCENNTQSENVNIVSNNDDTLNYLPESELLPEEKPDCNVNDVLLDIENIINDIFININNKLNESKTCGGEYSYIYNITENALKEHFGSIISQIKVKVQNEFTSQNEIQNITNNILNIIQNKQIEQSSNTAQAIKEAVLQKYKQAKTVL
jgi:hypothetical protein